MDERLVRVASVDGAPYAHLLAARLRADGVHVRLVGPGLGPYAFTVGAMAQVDVLVADADEDTARETLAELEVPALPPQRVLHATAPVSIPAWLVPALLLSLAAALLLLRARG